GVVPLLERQTQRGERQRDGPSLDDEQPAVVTGDGIKEGVVLLGQILVQPRPALGLRFRHPTILPYPMPIASTDTRSTRRPTRLFRAVVRGVNRLTRSDSCHAAEGASPWSRPAGNQVCPQAGYCPGSGQGQGQAQRGAAV